MSEPAWNFANLSRRARLEPAGGATPLVDYAAAVNVELARRVALHLPFFQIRTAIWATLLDASGNRQIDLAALAADRLAL